MKSRRSLLRRHWMPPRRLRSSPPGSPLPVGVAVGPVLLRQAAGTVGGDSDVVGVQPGALQPLGVEALEIHVELAGGQHLDGGQGGGPHGLSHGVGHVLVGLEAALGDAGADGGQDVQPVAAVAVHHALHRLGGDAQGGAPPAGVDRPTTRRTGS